MSKSKGEVYVFFRSGWSYLLDLENDEAARANAECNPGTIRVEDLHARVVWPLPAFHSPVDFSATNRDK
jgi:hypothetical protein